MLLSLRFLRSQSMRWGYQGSDCRFWRLWRYCRSQAILLTLSRFWPKILKLLNSALCFFISCFINFHQKPMNLKIRSKWERDQIVNSTNQTFFPLPNFMGKDNTQYHSFHHPIVDICSIWFPYFSIKQSLFLCYISGTWRLEENTEALQQFDKSISLWKAIKFVYNFSLSV